MPPRPATRRVERRPEDRDEYRSGEGSVKDCARPAERFLARRGRGCRLLPPWTDVARTTAYGDRYGQASSHLQAQVAQQEGQSRPQAVPWPRPCDEIAAPARARFTTRASVRAAAA